MIVVLVGEPGAGKTDQIQSGFPEVVAVIDGEYPRAQNHYAVKKYSRMIEFMQGRVIYTSSGKGYKRGQLDPVATVSVLEQSVDDVLSGLDRYETVAIDGISDIRSWVTAWWIHQYNINNPTKKRRGIKKENLTAWTEINSKVGDDLLFPIINACRDAGINCVLTASMRDEYVTYKDENGEMVSKTTGRRLPDVKDWILHECDTIVTLEYRKPHYYAVCSKSAVGCWEENITNRQLYALLVEKGL